MALDGDVFCKKIEILVRRQHGHVASFGRGTNQEIGVGTLDAFFAAKIEQFRGTLMVFPFQRKIGEGVQPLFDLVEFRALRDARKNLLANRSEEHTSELQSQSN